LRLALRRTSQFSLTALVQQGPTRRSDVAGKHQQGLGLSKLSELVQLLQLAVSSWDAETLRRQQIALF
jgi:hypothetical protein